MASDPIDELTQLLSRIPGLGKKSAGRMVYHLLKASPEYARRLGDSIATLKDRVVKCRVCGHYSESDVCPVCSDPHRDRKVLCVVEQDQDMVTVNSSREYNGLFHVMHGVLSPMDGVGPETLGLNVLVSRVEKEGIGEVIIATNPTPEGDTTALYVARLLKATGAKLTRLATGLPVGGDIEYADRLTISRSFRARVPLWEKETDA